MTDQIAIARRIATAAHAGQVDKSGAPYIGHPARVAARLAERGADEDQIAAGWLHDVIEDTGVTAGQLSAKGISDRGVAIVVAMTHLPGQSNAEYYLQVARQEGAAEVKEADLDDNTDPERRALIGDDATRARLDRKYEFAHSELARHRANGLCR